MAVPGREATLQDVARAAGVHASTASRALSDTSTIRGTVNAETRNRVAAAAKALGYRRNVSGARLRTGRTRVIGVLVPRITDLVMATVYEGIYEAARSHGYASLVASTSDDPAEREERIEAFVAHGVDGVLFTDAHLGSTRSTAGDKIPVLPCYRYETQPAGIRADDYLGGRLTAEHFLAGDHHTVGVLAGPAFASTTRDRVKGFTDTYRAAGHAVPRQLIQPCALDVAAGRAAATRLLSNRPDITAVFAVNDFTAIGVLSAARHLNRVVGEDLALVGYNDIPLSAELPVPLTSVASPLHDLGRAAAKSLLEATAGQPPTTQVYPVQLIVRASSPPRSKQHR